MTRRQLLISAAVVASVGIIACDGGGSTSPTSPSLSEASAADLSPSSSRSARQGNVIRVTKDCTQYFGRAGDTCTITSSNVSWIKVGSTVVYASDAAATGLDTDIMIDPPGRARPTIFGHCTLDLATGDGECRLWGGKGNGRFEDISATVVVSYMGGPNYLWDGTYRLGSKRD